MQPLTRAIDICSGLSRLAKAIGEQPSTVGNWRTRGVPHDRCAAIEQATAGQVRCEDLRSDVEWIRDANGQVTGYVVPVESLAKAG